MPYTVTASPTQAFADAIKATLDADATLMAIITGVFAHVSEVARVAYPYLVIGYRHMDDGQDRSMGKAGGRVTLQLDGWSDKKGPFQMHTILSRVRVLLDRQPLTVSGFTLVAGSLLCELEDVFDEPDADSPEKKLYRGMQRWTVELDEAA